MDPEPASYLFDLISVLALVFISSLFVAAEYALISCDPSRLRTDGTDSYKNRGKSTLWLLSHSEICVASIQLGNTLCSLLIGYLGISLFNNIFLDLFADAVFFQNYPGFPLILSFALALLFLTFLHLIFGELFVKAIATAYPEQLLRFLAGPMKLFTRLTYPLSGAAYLLVNFFLKPFHVTIGQADKAALSLAELKRLFSSVPSTNEIDSEQARMIRGVVGFSETIAREVMTPRTDLITIKADSTLDEVVQIILDSGFSRFPVRGERVDDVLGILLARDVMPFIVANDNKKREEFVVKKVMRQAYYVPGTKAIDELLSEFRRRKVHMAIVLDEHGGVDGVVTLEDIIEEIVGDIYDENDELEFEFTKDSNGDLLIGGGMLVSDLNEKFNLNIPEGQYDTVAGFIFTCLGRIPSPADEIFINKNNLLFVNGELEKSASSNGHREIAEDEQDKFMNEGITLSVEKVDGHRIELTRLHFVKDDSSQTSESKSELPSSELKGVLLG